MSGPNLKLASKKDRLINALIDTVVVVAVYFILISICIRIGITREPQKGVTIPLLPVLLPFPVWGYYMFFEFLFQRTLGKLVSKTEVVTTLGEKPSFGRIVRRTLFRSVPFNMYTFLNDQPGNHDKLSETRVVKIN